VDALSARLRAAERREHELEDALVRLATANDRLVARARSLVDRDAADVERQITALDTAIAGTQASIFWRAKLRLASLLHRLRATKIGR